MSTSILIISFIAIAIVLIIVTGLLILLFYGKKHLASHTSALKDTLQSTVNAQQEDFYVKMLQKTHEDYKQQAEHFHNLYTRLNSTFENYKENLQKNIMYLTQTSEQQIRNIQEDIANKLAQGLHSTHTTFAEINTRLSLIDAAQKNLHDLSSNIMSLQGILSDKKSRGAFGEWQLKALIDNMLPREVVSWQNQFPNGVRCDCLLKLPPPTGNIVIDAKFPLENYRKLMDATDPLVKQNAIAAFKGDIKRHLQDIAQKYIIAGVTADCALMFVPSEAIFAEIHSSCVELVSIAHNLRVWIVSPTTLMAILTTAASVLKDVETRKHVGEIKEHLRVLAQDFQRFDERWQKLVKHLELAYTDAQNLQTSGKKISHRLQRIEAVRMEAEKVEVAEI